MTNDAKTKFTIIGFGFLAGYLYPCYSRHGHINAVTADEATLEAKRARYPFPILLNGNARALEDMRPDVILFMPPPPAAPGLAREVLAPYYEKQRAEGRALPDLYAFPPSPGGDFYTQVLGEDVNICNILPNMTCEIAGKSLRGAEGASYITLADASVWPPENLARLEEIFAPLGGIVYVAPALVRDMLACLCVAEMLPLMVFDMADGLEAAGQAATPNQVAEAMRAAHQQRSGYRPKGSAPCSAGAVPGPLLRAIDALCEAWCGGAVDYLLKAGMDADTAKTIMVTNADLRLHIAQMEARNATEEALRSHATPGGVAERARLCYELLCSGAVRAYFSKPGAPVYDKSFFTFLQTASFEVAKTVAGHGKRLAGSAPPPRFTPEHHAILYGLFVRNAAALAGKTGTDATHEGTLLYARQRGARMAKRAAVHGDSLTPFSYMAYGEWAPEPGTMQAEDVSYMPDVVTQATVCPWLTAWERMGFLAEGAAYCSCIDEHLVRAFNPALRFRTDATRTEGAECCRFVWEGFGLDERAREALAKKKAELGDSCRKDWIYHTRHLYSALREKVLPLRQGPAIIEQTLAGFETLYGAGAREVVTGIDGINFYDI